MKKFFSVLLIFVLSFAIVACDEVQEQLGLPTELTEALESLTLPASEVTTDIDLPTIDGIDIVWQSSHPEIVNSLGQVHQPTFSHGDAEVTLTALILFEGQVVTKSFTVTVPKLPETDLEKLNKALEEVAGMLEEDFVTESIDLPTLLYGANIEWSSSNPEALDAEGNVLRPHFDDENAEVILTAFISAGAQLQMYKRTITVEKMPFKQYGLMNANEGAPLTFKIVTEEDHELYIPYGNVNKEQMVIQSPYPYVYTPTFDGEKVPEFVNTVGDVAANGWGLAYVVRNGIVDTLYDGIANKIYDAENPEGLPGPGATAYAADITIPEDGFVIVFHNSGAAMGNTLNGREFARSVMNAQQAIGKPLELVGLGLEDVGVQFMGGVFWRGFAEITVPFHFINPNLLNFDYTSTSMTNDEAAPLADGTNVVGAYPLLFNAAYFDTYGGTAVDTGQGYTLAAVMRPESEPTQTIQIQEEDRDIILSNEFEIYRVYDGIGGSIKTKGMASTSLPGGDSGKNMAFERDGFLAFWANNGVDYAADTHNRRIAADYFYAIENWVWGFTPVTAEDMIQKGYDKIDSADVLAEMDFVE